MRKYGNVNFTYGERCWSVFGNICKKCCILTEVGNICDIKIAHLWPGIYGVHLKCKTIKIIICYNFLMLNESCFCHSSPENKKIVVFHSRWETNGIDALYTQLWLLWVILHEHEPTTAMLLPPRRLKISNTLISLSGCIQTKSNKINQ